MDRSIPIPIPMLMIFFDCLLSGPKPVSLCSGRRPWRDKTGRAQTSRACLAQSVNSMRTGHVCFSFLHPIFDQLVGHFHFHSQLDSTRLVWLMNMTAALSNEQLIEWQRAFQALIGNLLVALDCPTTNAQYEYESRSKMRDGQDALVISTLQLSSLESTLASCLTMIQDAREVDLFPRVSNTSTNTTSTDTEADAGLNRKRKLSTMVASEASSGGDRDQDDRRKHVSLRGSNAAASATTTTSLVSCETSAHVATMKEWRARMQAFLAEQRKKTTAHNIQEFSSSKTECSRMSPLSNAGMIRKERVDNLEGPLDATLAFLPKGLSARANVAIDDDLLTLKQHATLDVRLAGIEQLLFPESESHSHASPHPLIRLKRIEQALLEIEKHHPSIALTVFHYDRRR